MTTYPIARIMGVLNKNPVRQSVEIKHLTVFIALAPEGAGHLRIWLTGGAVGTVKCLISQKLPKGAVKMTKPEIHISDVNTFRNCRVKWLFSSRNKMNLTRKNPYSPFFLGSAMHYAIAAFYTGGRRGAHRAINAYFSRQTETLGSYDLTAKQWEDVNEDIELAKAMIDNYARWAEENDDFELIPEIPIVADRGDYVFRGTGDGLLQRDGKYYLFEAKTCARLPQSGKPLLYDNQHISYMWGIAQDPNYAEYDIQGVLFTFLRKKPPTVPQTIKSGALSRRHITTTFETYLQAIRDHGLDPEDYREFLTRLKNQESPFFARYMMPNNSRRIEVFEKDFEATVQEMLNEPEIYPSPSRWYCPRCPFNDLCLMYLNGREIWPVLEANYREQLSGELAVIP
ncbi:hypothetical protein GF373_17775 [bacterium]|nr:hypothetical protein [bacterium]